MPRLDGTGPAGMGPRTGWGRGFCHCAPGMGIGSHFGFPWGSKKNQKEYLEQVRDQLKENLEAVEEELQGSEK